MTTQTKLTAAGFLEHVTAIAAELPGAWTVTPGDANPFYLTITRADDLKLAFYVNGGHYANDNSRAEVSFTHPRFFEVRHYDETAPKINATVTRKPGTVAADIARRLIDDAETMHATVLERVAAADAYTAAQSSTLETLTTAAAGMVWGTGDDDFRIRAGSHGVWGSVKAHRTDATLELHNVPTELAAAILELVAAHKNA